MKIALNQLPQHLSKNLLPIYLVAGDEILLVREAVENIKKRAKENGFEESTTITADASTNIAEHLYKDSHSISLFAEKKIIILNLSHIKLNAANGKKLEEYLKKPAADTILIIHSNKLDARSEKSNWFKQLAKNGAFIQVWPIQPNQLASWIIQRGKTLNINITYDAATHLASQVEGNLLAASQEIEKLSLLKPNSTIDLPEITATITDSTRFDVFNLVDSIFFGNATQAFRILNNLKLEGAEPTFILWAITRELRTVIEIQENQNKGIPIFNLYRQFGVWEKRQPIINAAIKRHTPKFYANLLNSCCDLDKIIKGAAQGNFWDECEKLIVKIGPAISAKAGIYAK